MNTEVLSAYTTCYTHKHMIHAIVPSFGERRELRVMVDSLVSAELGRVTVQHYLVSVHLLSPFYRHTQPCNISQNQEKFRRITNTHIERRASLLFRPSV